VSDTAGDSGACGEPHDAHRHARGVGAQRAILLYYYDDIKKDARAQWRCRRARAAAGT